MHECLWYFHFLNYITGEVYHGKGNFSNRQALICLWLKMNRTAQIAPNRQFAVPNRKLSVQVLCNCFPLTYFAAWLNFALVVPIIVFMVAFNQGIADCLRVDNFWVSNANVFLVTAATSKASGHWEWRWTSHPLVLSWGVPPHPKQTLALSLSSALSIHATLPWLNLISVVVTQAAQYQNWTTIQSYCWLPWSLMILKASLL